MKRNFFEPLEHECYNSAIEKDFPEELPLLQEFRRVKISDKSFLKDVVVLFIQHHLCPFIGRLKVMQRDGMSPENSWFIDIPYSSNKEVIKKIKSDYTTHKYPNSFSNPLDNYSDIQLERVISVIKRILKSNPGKLLVVDDGAYFIRALHNIFISDQSVADKLYNKTYIVEQTTRGHRYLESLKYSAIKEIINASIVSIARTNTKLEIESPFIGIACKKAIEENEKILSLINSRQKDGRKINIAIIGFGAIGQSVFSSVKSMIKKPLQVDIVELDYDKWEEIRIEGGNPISELSNVKYDMLFGCTGKKAFGWKDRNKVNNNGLLVSVSSASVEFSRSNYIEFADLYPDDPIEITVSEPEKGIHSDLLFTDGKTQFYFTNSGFPVNFTGKKECLPLKFIQPTHALLYAACYQVLNNPVPGLHKLKEEYDYWIYYNAFNY